MVLELTLHLLTDASTAQQSGMMFLPLQHIPEGSHNQSNLPFGSVGCSQVCHHLLCLGGVHVELCIFCRCAVRSCQNLVKSAAPNCLGFPGDDLFCLRAPSGAVYSCPILSCYYSSCGSSALHVFWLGSSYWPWGCPVLFPGWFACFSNSRGRPSCSVVRGRSRKVIKVCLCMALGM
jgi:hypothetical protein